MSDEHFENQEEKRDPTESRIVNAAVEVVMTRGVKALTMGDLATKLGMSKKTLYKYVNDKDELVLKAIKSILNEVTVFSENVINKGENALEILLILFEYHKRRYVNTPMNLLGEVEQNHPRAWEYFIRFKKNIVVKDIILNLERGVKEGLYRKDINPEVLAAMRIDQIHSLFEISPELLKKYDLNTIHYQTNDHFMHGLLSDKGKKLLDNYRNQLAGKINFEIYLNDENEQ